MVIALLRTSPPEADKPSALLIKIRSVVLVFFVRVGLCGLAGSTCLGVASAKPEASCEAWSVANLYNQFRLGRVSEEKNESWTR